MANEGAGRAPQALKRCRLERQQAKHMVDMRAHRRRTTGAPGPDARTDIVDDRDGGRCRPHLAGNAQAEFRTVDGDQAIRPGLGNGARGGADPPHQPRQVADNRAEPHQRDLGRVEKGFQPLALQMMAANADDLDRPSAHRAKRANKIGAEQIAGFLAGDNGDTQRRAGAAQVPSSCKPTTKRPNALASAQTAS